MGEVTTTETTTTEEAGKSAGQGAGAGNGARLDHIGIAVRDLDAAGRFYKEVLGLAETTRELAADRGLKIAFIPAGDSRIELLEPTDPQSAVARFLDTRGEGLHHIAFTVDSVEEALARAKEAGYTLIDEKPRPGAGGALIAFVHPKSVNGVLLEFCRHGDHHGAGNHG